MKSTISFIQLTVTGSKSSIIVFVVVPCSPTPVYVPPTWVTSPVLAVEVSLKQEVICPPELSLQKPYTGTPSSMYPMRRQV